MKKKVISKEVALGELETFINKFVKKPAPKEEFEETYPDILEAIMDGFLSFKEDGIPLLKLKDPIKLEDGSILISEINFRTRIKPTTLADLAKGLHPQKEVFTLQLRMTAYIIDQTMSMLDKFERYDYDVINQVSTVFS
jgi:hypothetical protein